ncbi:MAG: hypothetical protein ABW072_08745 [Sedimenticola sp.]
MSKLQRYLPVLFSTLLLLFTSQTSALSPKLMVVMQEKVMGVFGTTGFEQPNQSEIALMNHFQDAGFRVVDPDTAKRNITQAKGLRMLEGDDKAAAAVGLQYGADYTVVGTAISKPAGAKLYGSQLQSIHATVTARVVRNSDARVIASASASGIKAHIDEVQGGVLAIGEAIGTLASRLSSRIPMDEVAPGSAVGDEKLLHFTGLVSYRHIDYLMRFLEKKVKGVNQVELVSFSHGIAEVTIDYSDSMSLLARTLSKQKFKGFRLEPTHVTPNRMDLRAVVQPRR